MLRVCGSGAAGVTTHRDVSTLESSPDAALRLFCDIHRLDAGFVGKELLGQAAHRIETVSGEAFSGRIAALRIERSYGQFGNNFYQLLNALIVARRLGCVELRLPPMQGTFGQFPLLIDGIRIAQSSEPVTSGPTLVGVFFAPYGFEPLFHDADMAFVVDTIERFVCRLYDHLLVRVVPLGPSVLAMHFRGGDVFRESGDVHPWYVQPPASYYVTALEHAQKHLGVDSVQLVFQGRENPAVEEVERYLSNRGVPFSCQSADLPADLRCLFGARHLVAPYGTFCEAVAMMSAHCTSYFAFRDLSSQHDMEGFPQSRVDRVLQQRGIHTMLIEDPDRTYTPQRSWRASADQLQLVRDYPKSALRVAEIEASRDEWAPTSTAKPQPQTFGVSPVPQSPQKRIFDCFTFFNELEILKLRFHELYDAVDCFVISESTKTFRGEPKPLVFTENKEMFREFMDKIRLIVVDDMPTGTDAWQREFHQRSALRRGLVDLNENDIVMVSDVDEIVRASTLDYVRHHDGYFLFDMPMYQFYLNMRAVPSGWVKAIAYTWKLDSEVGDYNRIRQRELDSFSRFTGINHRIEQGGWHFTFLGGPNRVREKLGAYSHAEAWQQQMLRSGEAERQMVLLKDVGGGRHLEFCEIDDTFPKYVRTNIQHFRDIGYVKDAPSRIRELVSEFAHATHLQQKASAGERYWKAEFERAKSSWPVSDNIALNKPATQSSINSWSHGKTPEEDARGGNDGQIREPGGYGFHTDKELDPWWQVDLMEQYYVEEVRLYNRKGGAADRLRHFSVLASDDGTAWDTIFRKSDDAVFSERPYVISLNPPVRTRFVRIKLDGDNWLHFDQCFIYGRPIGANDQTDAPPRGTERQADPEAKPIASNSMVTTAVQLYLAGDPPFKLEIGRPRKPKAGWLTVDRDPAPPPLIQLDVSTGTPAPDGSFDFIYSEHAIQRASFQTGLAMLVECHRVLKLGGVLRIATPSLDSLLRVASPGGTLPEKQYLEWSVRLFVSDAPIVTPAFFLNNFMRSWDHTFIYDRETMRRALQLAGFDTVMECEIGQSQHEPLRALEDEERMPPGFLRIEDMVFEAIKQRSS